MPTHSRFPSAGSAARIAAVAVLATLAFSACARRPATTRPQVGVTLLTEAHVFYQDLKRGMQHAAESLGVDLHVVAGEWDLARQTSQVQNFITQRMDAIVIAPVDSRGIVSAVEEANRAGIPVFTADIAAAGGEVVSHVASDNAQGGRLVGEYLARVYDECKRRPPFIIRQRLTFKHTQDPQRDGHVGVVLHSATAS